MVFDNLHTRFYTSKTYNQYRIIKNQCTCKHWFRYISSAPHRNFNWAESVATDLFSMTKGINAQILPTDCF